jgi:hypothetical protein
MEMEHAWGRWFEIDTSNITLGSAAVDLQQYLEYIQQLQILKHVLWHLIQLPY